MLVQWILTTLDPSTCRVLDGASIVLDGETIIKVVAFVTGIALVLFRDF
jgi:hypothetical protein